MFLGYFFQSYLESFMQPMVENFRERVESGDIKLTIESIFFNNFSVAMMIYFGAIFLGLITTIILITNGLFIGYFATSLPLDIFLIFTLPHGIFEIPGIIIAGAAGFCMISFIPYFLKDIIFYKKNEWGEIANLQNRIIISFNKHFIKLSQSLILFGIATILLILAAFIEVYITINLAKFLIGDYS